MDYGLKSKIIKKETLDAVVNFVRSIISGPQDEKIDKKFINKRVAKLCDLIADDIDAADGANDGVVQRKSIEAVISEIFESEALGSLPSTKARDIICLFERNLGRLPNSVTRAAVKNFIKTEADKISDAAFDLLDSDKNGFLSCDEVDGLFKNAASDSIKSKKMEK